MSDVKAKKGRCSRCFQCPQCFTTLSTRSVIVPLEVLGDQTPQKTDKPSTQKSPGGTKVYFLSCSHCKWSTRDVGIKDKRSPIDFKDRPSPHSERITALITFYKEYASQDNAAREKAKKSVSSSRRQRPYGSLLDPTKFSLKAGGGSESPTSSRRSQVTWSKAKVDAMVAEAGDPLPPSEDLYTEEVDLEETPTLEQQLKDPVYQPRNSSELWPCQLRLTGKKLHRCKGCDHILMKAEMNLSSIRFKIQQAALHTFPQVRIAEPPTLTLGTPSKVILSITNPLNYGITVSFSQCSPEILARTKEPLASVSPPEGQFYLTPNDDVVELLGGESESEIKDDPEFVHNRLAGKLFLNFRVVPESAKESTHFMFAMEFGHKSTVEADKENEMTMVTVPVLIRLNKPTGVSN